MLTKRSVELPKLIKSLALGLLLSMLTACQGSQQSQARNQSLAETNGSGKTLLLLGQATEPAVVRSMQDYVDATGEVPAGFVFYLILSGDLARTQNELATIDAFMARHPDTVLQLALGYGPELLGNAKESLYLLAGGFDPELTALAQWLRSQDRPVLLRPLYEFDRACNTYGPPEVYKPAYRYIVDSLRNAGVNNTRYVWQSTGPGLPLDHASFFLLLGSTSNSLGDALDPAVDLYDSSVTANFCPISNFYPGDGYVDFFAISYWGDALFGEGNERSREIYQLETRRMLDEARRLGLELMIAESTPAYVGTTSGDASLRWMQEYFDLVEEYDIRVLSYIATEWFDEGGNWGSPMFRGFFPPDARIHANDEIFDYWHNRIGNSRYLQQGDADFNALLGLNYSPEPLAWQGEVESPRDQMRWPNCPPPLLAGSGGWCLPVIPGL